MRPGDDVAAAGGRLAVWNVDRAGDGDRPAARVGRAVEDAEGVAHAAHSGAAALERPDPNDAPGLSGNFARAYVVKRICRIPAAKAENGGNNPGCYKPRQDLRREHTLPPCYVAAR